MTLIETARSFSDEIRQRSDEFEAARRPDEALAYRMAEAGLFDMLVPETYGGSEAHPSELFRTLETVAAADGATGWCLMIGATTGLLAASLDEEWARRIYGGGRAITSGVTAPLGRAVPEADGYRVTGRWPFGSASQISSWICGGAVIMEGDTPRPGKGGTPEFHLMFFPAAEVTVHDTWHTSGLCGTGSHDIEVREAFVPAGRNVVLGGRPRIDRPLYRFPTLGLLALGVSAVAVGIAARAVDAFKALAGGKVPTGSTRSLANRGNAQKDLALALAGLGSARAYVHDVIGAAYERAREGERLGAADKADLRLAATNATWRAVDAVDRLYHAAGGTSVYRDNALERCFRDVHVATQHILVARPTLEVVGKVALGIDPKTLL